MAKNKKRTRKKRSPAERKLETALAKSAVKRYYETHDKADFLRAHVRFERRHRELLAARGICISRERRDKLNHIDVRELVKKTQTEPDDEGRELDADLNRAVKKKLQCGPWYTPTDDAEKTRERVANAVRCFTPCFREGILIVSDGFELYFRVIDVLDDRVRLELQEFVGVETSSDVKALRAVVFADIRLADDGEELGIEYGVDKDTSLTTAQIYDIVPSSDITSDPAERFIWETQSVTYARKTTDAAREEFFRDTLKTYAFSITRVNYFLDTKSVSRPEPVTRDDEDVEESHVVERRFAPAQEDTRRVRHVGPVRVLSTRPPRPVTARTIKTYRVESWQVRGHIRKLKSGRTVYVQPHVNRRRGMPAGGASPAPVDIRVRVPRRPVQTDAAQPENESMEVFPPCP